MGSIFYEYSALFVGSFLASTLLPFSSEAMLILALTQGSEPWSCLFIATTGNTLGGLTNYGVGLLGNPLWLKRFRISEDKLLRFEDRIKRHGFWLALLSWVPFVGDPLTAALGFFRVPFLPVLGLLTLGKFLRYLVLILPFL
ncbi:MAG: hypothetical protein RIT43_1684 [Bacteroidota bacterium]|jgi:membrane protein YqaA with SNARE-associated domain